MSVDDAQEKEEDLCVHHTYWPKAWCASCSEEATEEQS